jgi:O-methyltransferase involved in polyketide biosynthesis
MTQTDAVALPETALVTMCFRANEARRHNGILDDPMAIRLTETVDYDFTKLKRSNRQDLALRAVAFDDKARQYLSAHPEATVVALGEGMQTSFWRLEAGDLGDKFRWLSVDLPPIIELRERLLPRSPRISMCAQSALEFSWMDRVKPQHGVFVTAEGLLPYLEPAHALSLIRECARRFPGGQMMFDLPSKWYATLANSDLWATLHGGWPRMPFSLSVSELTKLPESVPEIRAVHNLRLPRGRGPVFNLLWKTQGLPVYQPLHWLIGMKWPTVATLALLEFSS